MSEFKSDFLKILQERGFIHQISDESGLDDLLTKETVTCYIGFDPTGPSLHAGHMMGIMLLYWFQKTGHRPIALMGGGTALVGDPSGKDEARQMLTEETIAGNINNIRKSFEAFLDFDAGDNAAKIENNAEWLKKINYIEFLRDYGKNFSVNSMLARDSVKNRLDREQHLSLLEFNYMCLQAYDYVELNARHGTRLQMGGSDQWGNIVSGVDLGRRHGTDQLFGLTCPLLTTSSGAKMGKTADGAVWLNGDMLSPFDYWQYWRNTEDADVPRFLKLFTPLPMDEIAKLSTLQGAELNEAKKILATEATAMVHGREIAEQAQETARKTFEEGSTAVDLPTHVIGADALNDGGIGILNAIVEAGLAKSNGEARRHIKGGAIKINDVAVADETHVISADDLNNDGLKLSFGKKRHVLLKS